MKIARNVIVPSIIASNQKELDKRLAKVKDITRTVQLDIMDGHFVDNKSLDFDFELPEAKCLFEAQLMVKDPEKWVEKNCEKVDSIIIHIESCEEPMKVIESVKECGGKVGLALNPGSPIGLIDDFLGDIHQVTVMTVEPGKYGGKFLPEMLEKVKKLRKMRSWLDIEVDGGISPKNIKAAADAGANMFVSGSYIQNSKDPKKAIKELMDELKIKIAIPKIPKWKK